MKQQGHIRVLGKFVLAFGIFMGTLSPAFGQVSEMSEYQQKRAYSLCYRGIQAAWPYTTLVVHRPVSVVYRHESGEGWYQLQISRAAGQQELVSCWLTADGRRAVISQSRGFFALAP